MPATVKTTQSQSWKGQGPILWGDYDPTTGTKDMAYLIGLESFPCGNRTLSTALTKETSTLKESCSGQRLDLEEIDGAAEMTFTLELQHISPRLLAHYFYGAAIDKAAGTVTAERLPTIASGDHAFLRHPNVSSVVIEGRRVLGDFSNATAGNRTIFQTAGANSVSDVAVMPSGTGTVSGWRAYNTSDPNNASLVRLEIGTAEALIRSGQIGTGSFLPLSFYTNNTSRLTISTAGKFSIGGAASAWDTDKTPIQFVAAQSSLWSHDTNKTIGIGANYYFAAGGRTAIAAGASAEVQVGTGGAYLRCYPSALANALVGAALVDFNVTPAGAQLSTPQLLGYGIGAGGTVTQSSSKSTAVTLNKPCGRITSHNASLPGGTSVAFTLNNSLIAADSAVYVQCSSPQNYKVRAGLAAAGSIPVYIENTTVGGLSDALTITFIVFNGVSS